LRLAFIVDFIEFHTYIYFKIQASGKQIQPALYASHSGATKIGEENGEA
jgi:hypothetical protein